MGDLYDEVLAVFLREAPMYPGHFVSRCGKFVRNVRYENITKVYSPNKLFAYLQSDGIRIHRLVASAWVHNPYPGKFDTVDHMDSNTQNNDATNLRWVSRRLNCIHRCRKRYYERVRTRSGRVYYVSKIRSDGTTTKLYSPTQQEAEVKTKTLINEMFRKIYNENLLDAPPGIARRSDMFLWTEPPKKTPRRSVASHPGAKRTRANRQPRYSF